MEWKDKRAEEYRKLLERAQDEIAEVIDDLEWGWDVKEMLEILWRDIHNALKED